MWYDWTMKLFRCMSKKLGRSVLSDKHVERLYRVETDAGSRHSADLMKNKIPSEGHGRSF